MKEELLEKIRKEYEERKQKQTEIKEKLQELSKLKLDKNVQRYLNLQQEICGMLDISIVNQTDKQLIDSVYNQYLYQMEETNQIFVYLGTYRHSVERDIEHGSNDYLVDKNDVNADYRMYQDIELKYPVCIPIKLCEEFECTHQVIFAKGYLKERIFYHLQSEFFHNAIKYGQEQAIIMLLEKSN